MATEYAEAGAAMPDEEDAMEPEGTAPCDLPQWLSDEFFREDRVAETNHEEWLLRQYRILMHREATAVSVLEQQAAAAQRTWKRRARSRNNSGASTRASTETDAPPYSES